MRAGELRPTSARASRTRPPARRSSPRGRRSSPSTSSSTRPRRSTTRARSPRASARAARGPARRARASGSGSPRARRRAGLDERRGPPRRSPLARGRRGGRAPRARRARPSSSAWRPRRRSTGFPDDVPIRNRRHASRSVARHLPEAWPRRSEAPATKHRGNAAGIVETRGRTGRKPTDDERKRRASRAGRGSAREERFDSRRPGAARSTARVVSRRSSSSLADRLLFKRPIAAGARARRVHAAPLHPARLLHRPVHLPPPAAPEARSAAKLMDVRMFTVGPVQENSFLVRRDGARPRADRRPRRRGRPRCSAPSTSSAWSSRRSCSPHALRPRRRGRAGRPRDRRAGLLPGARGRRSSRTSWATSRGPASARSRPGTPSRPSRAASASTLAGFDIDVIFTPGHSPGHVTYAVADEEALFSRRRPVPGLGRAHRPARRRLADAAALDRRRCWTRFPTRRASTRATWA